MQPPPVSDQLDLTGWLLAGGSTVYLQYFNRSEFQTTSSVNGFSFILMPFELNKIDNIDKITVITRRVVSIDFYRLIDTIDNIYVIDIDSYRFEIMNI